MTQSDESQFEVKLGRLRSPSGAKKARGLFKRIGKSARKVSTIAHGRYGRTQRYAARSQHQRRVIVKAHYIKMEGSGAGRQAQHVNYVERDGVGPEGERGVLYDKDGTNADKDAFVERGADDRHQFRIIVSPEDAHELQDLSALTRDLVSEMEADLGTKLDWIAVNHYDTGQPHTHLIIAGRRDDGTDLVIPRDTIANGIRNRAQELVELELGPVTEFDHQRRVARMVSQERFTAIDRGLFQRAKERVIDLSAAPRSGAGWKRQLERQRLKHLATLDLATPLGKGRWKIAPGAEQTLRRLGTRGDIIKSMHRAMQNNDQLRTIDASAIFDPATSKSITGAVIAKGVADDVNDRAYIVVDTLNGKPCYVPVNGEAQLAEYAKGQIVTVSPPNMAPRPSDFVIEHVAKSNGGRYSGALHLAADKSARGEFIDAHIRRLEALRRAGRVERQPSGVWTIPGDYIERVQSYEKAMAQTRPAVITAQSKLTLSQMTSAMGATWLDRHMRDTDETTGATGFGREVEAARNGRRQFLKSQGFLSTEQSRLSQSTLEALEQRDLQNASAALSQRLDKPYASSPSKGRINGIYVEAIDRPSGKYALIERAKDFTLVPWRDVLERNRGKSVSGLIRNGRVSWRLTRGRSLS